MKSARQTNSTDKHKQAALDALAGQKKAQVNCWECNDTKRRLGITCLDSKILLHCFNCGFRRRIPVDTSDTLQWEECIPETRSSDDLLRYMQQQEPLAAYARAWLLQYTSNTWIEDALESLALRWDSKTRSLALSIRHSTSDPLSPVIAIQHRNFNAYGAKYRTTQATQKYKTHNKTRRENIPLWSHLSAESGTLVLTEDYFSALAVQQAGYQALCCFGTRLLPEALDKVQAERAIIWLDNDNPEVRRAQRIMQQRTELWFPCIQMRQTDAKHFSIQGIQELLRDKEKMFK